MASTTTMVTLSSALQAVPSGSATFRCRSIDHVTALAPRTQLHAQVWGRLCATAQHLILSSNDPNSAVNHLVALHADAALHSLSSPCAASSLDLPQVVRDVVPLSDTSLLCAVGHGEVQVVALSPQGKLSDTHVRAHLQSDCIRQLAVRPGMFVPSDFGVDAGNGSMLSSSSSSLSTSALSSSAPSGGSEERVFAMGGFDEELHVAVAGDARISGLRAIPCSDYIGSIKWRQGLQVSCTLDGGMYRMYDASMVADEPTIEIYCEKQDLYAHEYVADDMHVLLGFGDGEMRLYDLRQSSDIVAQWFDPPRHAIGDLTFHSSSQTLLVCGAEDFSFWSMDSPLALRRLHMTSVVPSSAFQHPAIVAAQRAEETEQRLFPTLSRSFHAVFSEHRRRSSSSSSGASKNTSCPDVVALSSDGLVVIVEAI